MIRDGIRRAFSLALRRRDRWERDVEDEVKLHLYLRAEQLAADGLSEDDACREAVRRFGPLSKSRTLLLEAAQHRETRMQRSELFDDLRQDVAFALRTLARQKSWAAVTVATLALGIGATTAVFSVVSTLLLHPFSYPHADRLVLVDQRPGRGNNAGISVTLAPSAPAIRAWKQSSHSFEALEAARIGPKMVKTTSGEPATVMTGAVLPSFADFAGVRPLVGRMFTDNDIIAGGRVAVLGEAYWREHLGASKAVLGQMITLGDSSYMVVGVAPATLRWGSPGSRPTDVWLPFDLRDDHAAGSVIGRLRPGTSIDMARRELDSIAARSMGSSGKPPFTTFVSTPAQRVRFRDSLLLLTGAVALVLLVACVNVAHLLLARAATRRREMAVRAALGAGRGRLLRQLLTESLLLSVAGTIVGLGVGWAGVRAMISLRPSSHNELKAAHLDATTFALAVAVAVASGIVFGIIGAIQSSRSSTHNSLKAGSISTSPGQGHQRVRSVLVVSEMALSAMLVVGAALVVRSLTSLQSTQLGFDPRGLYSLYLEPASRAVTPEARAALLAEFTARVKSLPGVQSVTVADVGPGSRSFSIGRLEVEGEPLPAKAGTSFVDVNRVQPDYFAAMRIAFREGATFADTTSAAHEVIVNEGFARKHWKPGSAVGHRLRVAQTDTEPWLTIVGVVNDALTTGPMSESSAPTLYGPSADAGRVPSVLVRTDRDAAALAPAVTIGRQLGMRDVTIDGTEAFLERSLSEPRFVTLIMTVFGVLGLVLAAVGLYGVMSYTVAQQTREIGIRVALGAASSNVVNRVLTRGAGLAVAGALVGLAGASWGTKLIQAQLYGVARLDALSFAAGAIILVGAALLACVVPARRALAVDPVTAIRAE